MYTRKQVFNCIHTKMARFWLTHIRIDILYSKVRNSARNEQHFDRPAISQSLHKLLQCMISVIENSDANLRGTKVTPHALQWLTFSPSLKTDSVKHFASMSYSYSANFIPIHQLGTEILSKRFFGYGLIKMNVY